MKNQTIIRIKREIFKRARRGATESDLQAYLENLRDKNWKSGMAHDWLVKMLTV